MSLEDVLFINDLKGRPGKESKWPTSEQWPTVGCGEMLQRTGIRNVETLAGTEAPYPQTEEPVFIKLRNVVNDWFFLLWESFWMLSASWIQDLWQVLQLSVPLSLPVWDESFTSRVVVQIEHDICIGCAWSSGPGPGERGEPYLVCSEGTESMSSPSP